ncbi:MAG: uncharacterized protein PWP08_1166 [Methanofollis sp.]|nr:uncharacterized protein [Methanofollis sp.]
MLGTLTRYLRLMGYDTLSANALSPGNPREDTVLLSIAAADGRLLLTRDAELARRGRERAVYLAPENPMEQVRYLAGMGLIVLSLRFDRCSLCNTPLRAARKREIESAAYAPAERQGLLFYWCPICRRLYWEGSHTRRIRRQILDADPGDQD